MSDPMRDPLDQAIDRVAARLVSVDRDREMVERIVTRLPERSRVGGWLHVLVPQGAVAAALIIAGMAWTMSDREDVVRDPVAAPSVAEAGAPARHGAAAVVPPAGVDTPVNASRMAARRITPTEPMLPADHERSLAPVEAPPPLEIVSLNSPSLPEEAFVVLAPIVLTELPLSGESISPR